MKLEDMKLDDIDEMKKQALKEQSWWVVYDDTNNEFETHFPKKKDALKWCDKLNKKNDGIDYAVVPRKIWNEISWNQLVDQYGYEENLD